MLPLVNELKPVLDKMLSSNNACLKLILQMIGATGYKSFWFNITSLTINIEYYYLLKKC